MNIRPRKAGDDAAIDALVRDAFAASAHGYDGEAELVATLRDDDDAAIELVAESEDGEIVGHIMLSPMRAPEGALGLAPVSAKVGRQQRGIGAMLMDAAIARAAGSGASMIFLLGDPAYYGRFGFSADTAAAFESAYPGPNFQALRLSPDAPERGRAEYARAFQNSR